MPDQNLLFSGAKHPSSNKKFEEVVVFVHHFGGSPSSSKRHIKMVNDMGFDAFSFALKGGSEFPREIPFSSEVNLGITYVWAEQIEMVLNSLSGKKILYSFSSPSNACSLALAKRYSIDVSAWICDGGPFLNFSHAMWNYFTYEKKISLKIPRAIATLASRFLYGPNYEKTSLKALQSLSSEFPILSIRNWKDQLVTPRSIEEYFDRSPEINIEVLAIPEGGHLTGLRDSAEIYVPRVENFLVNHATAIS